MIFLPRYEPKQTALIRITAQPVEYLSQRLETESVYTGLSMHDDFLEAIASASPSLANTIVRARKTKISANDHAKLVDAIWNYRLRATTRPAPFGLLAGVAVIPVKKKGCFTDLSAKFKIKTRYDPRIHWNKAGKQAQDDPSRDTWTINPSVYAQADTLRYLAFPFDAKAAIHTVNVNPDLADTILQFRTPLSLNAMTSKLMDTCALSTHDARNTLLALAQNGFLVSTAQPAVTHFAATTSEREIKDLVLSHKHIALSKETAAQVARTIELIGVFTPPSPNPLALLCTAITQRWGRQKIPLMQLFDPETGLTINGHPARMFSDFLAHTSTDESRHLGNEASIAVTDFLEARKKILTPPLEKGERVIDLAQIDTTSLPPHTQEQWPSSLAGIFSIVQEGPKNTIWFETAAGPDSTRLMARFGAIDPEIAKALQDSRPVPNNFDTDAIHCEVFIPPFFTGAETLTRQNLYGKVIACDGSPNPANDIRLADLAVQVHNGHILLIDAQTNRRVIPHFSHPVRLDTTSSPAHVRFLARMATMPRFRSLRWEWAEDEIRLFMPRVVCSEVVVSPACWTLCKTDFPSTDLVSVRRRLRELGLPALFKLVTGQDTPLTLIMKVDTCLRTLITALNYNARITLQECPSLNATTVRLSSGNHVSDFVLPLHQTKTVSQHSPIENEANTSKVSPPVRECSDLSDPEWHSLHIPCLETRTDALLVDFLAPLISDLHARHWLRQWHFVREMDETGAHLRLRLLPQAEPGVAQCVSQHVADVLAIAEATRLIDTPIQRAFVPEVRRYGGKMRIKSVIRYFTKSSNFSINWLKQHANSGDRVRIIEHALMSAIILAQGVTLSGALTRCKSLHQRIAADLLNDTDVRQLSGKIFRDEKTRDGAAIKILLEAQKKVPGNSGFPACPPGIDSHDLKAIPPNTSDDILFSIIHMNGNRIFRYAQRSHENVAYDLASRILMSMLMINEQKNS